jgi:foldase protein PrsA
MRQTLAAAFCALCLIGCEAQPAPTAPGEVPEPTTRETTAQQAPQIMATVNGQPIYMDPLHRSLVRVHGLLIPEMLIHDLLIDQEAKRRGVSVGPEDVAAENDISLRNVFPPGTTPDQRERLLDQLLRDRGLTRELWEATVRRNALLRKMVAPGVTVTEDLVKAEFARAYGAKVEVRQIRLPSVEEAQKILALAEKGDDFAKLARDYSTDTITAPKGGLLPVFTRQDTFVPRAVRDAAFALKDGQVSSIVQVGSSFHVLKLVKRVTPPQIEYESVKDQLSDQVRQRMIMGAQAQLMSELRRRADVEYINPILRQEAKRYSQP